MGSESVAELLNYTLHIYFQMPLTSTCLIISNFALRGISFLVGFYSKNLILEIVYLDYVSLLGYFF